MIPKTKKRLKRILIPLLFCVAASLILGVLNASNEAKLRKYEEELQSIPVTLTVTTSTGELEEDEKLFTYEWVYRLFTEREPVKFYDVSAAGDDSKAKYDLKKEVTPTELSLAEYVKDVRIMISQEINNVSGYSYGRYDRYYAYGITSLACDPLLASEDECEITWYEGYDESVFAGDGLYCLIPNSKLEEYDNGNGEAVVSFYYSAMSHKVVNGEVVKEKIEREYPCTLKIAGTYTGGDWNSVYCPLDIVKKVCSELETKPFYHYLSATLADNSRLDEFREKTSLCFLEPSPENEDIPWGYYAEIQNCSFYHEFYPLGLAIDDEALLALPDVTEECARFAGIVKIVTVALSVIAGILAGYLIIRDNKSGILQKREAGRSNTVLYFGFMLEQLLCTVVGVAIGGAYFMWKPTENYLIFAAVYFAVLSIALAIFMNKRIIETITGDEE